VSRTDSHDRAIEGELRRRKVPPPGASAACLDAETLAGWADGNLGGEARALAEVHMASCARCQSILAAIVNSGAALEPAPGHARREWWRIDLRWLVPLAGAAAAVLLWAVVPDRAGSQQARGAESGPPPGPSPVAASPPVAKPGESPAPEEAAAAPTDSEGKLVARAEPAAPPVDQQKRVETRESSDRARQAQERSRNAADLMAKAEAPAAPVAGVAPAAPAAPSEPSRAEADRPAAAAPAPVTQAFGTEARQSSDTGSRIDLTSAMPGVRWRIANPGIVERSSDGGASWERLDTGVRSTLTAGTCPSASVCWVVGGAGVVLLTIDGRTWQRLTPPTPADLVAVEAVSDRRAVVRTAAGLRYQTQDGGVTWTR
jgi:hypothetical protein